MHSALVISPFATTPVDAGHRRRTYQMTRLLADAGYRVTFLLYAFEGVWYWRHDEAAFARLREQWAEVIVLYADRAVGMSPKVGDLHVLDEWWDPKLEALLVSINSRRFFDVVVVHNVWLSKAFDFFPSNTVKVLETHDLFWKRKLVFERLGMKAEFFVPSEASEVFGCKRADILVTIQDAEGLELLTRTGKPVVTAPFYDVALESVARPVARTGYLSPHKVTFGVLANDNPFNVVGLDALLVELEKLIEETFAPVEIVAAGRVGERIEKRAGVKCVGVVETEAQFYDTVDFAIAPVFDGTGFKIKTADALALMMPTLLSAHAAEGAEVDESLVSAGPKEMARRMVDIALERPPLGEALAHVRRSRRALRERAEAGADALIEMIERSRDYLAIDLSGLEPASDPLILFSWMATLHIFTARFKVLLILSEEAKRVLGPRLPLSVTGMTPAEFRARSQRLPMTILEIVHPIDREALGVLPEDRVLHDVRWKPESSDRDSAYGVFGALPLLSKFMNWEPNCQILRRLLPAKEASRWRPADRRTRIVYIDEPVGVDRVDVDGKTVSFFVATSDPAAFRNSVFALLDWGIAEVVWSAKPTGAAHRIVLEAVAARGIGFHGWVDPVVYADGRLPPKLDEDFEACGRVVVTDFKVNALKLAARGSFSSPDYSVQGP